MSQSSSWERRPISIGSALATMMLIGLGGCASKNPPAPTGQPVAAPAEKTELNEIPVPDGPWREHRLARCAQYEEAPSEVEKYLGLCSEFFREGSGSDGMIEMEMGLEKGYRHSLMLLTLGQLYVLAGQGDPDLLPVEGPAADVGDWQKNQKRLLSRARALLEEAAPRRPDDAAVDYLLADVARAFGDFDLASELVAKGYDKCTGGRSFRILQMYQQLFRYPARYVGGPSPTFPQDAADRGVGGEVILDLLINPAGKVRQMVEVSSPDAGLTKAASASLSLGAFEAARVGKYPVWSWLRVTTAFNLEPSG